MVISVLICANLLDVGEDLHAETSGVSVAIVVCCCGLLLVAQSQINVFGTFSMLDIYSRRTMQGLLRANSRFGQPG